MSPIRHIHCTPRFLLTVSGIEAESFLHNLVTTDIEKLALNAMRPGALLTPQGKIMFDFLIGRNEQGFLFDLTLEQGNAFVKRLSLYKLRAQVDISESKESLVVICWQNESAPSQFDSAFQDKRFSDNENVRRYYHVQPSPALTDETAWESLRIQYGIAEGGVDYPLNDAFPHDVNLDQIGGLSFQKGCYIGQEVVSRMHHRGTARRRVLIATGDHDLPPRGTMIKTEEKPIGTLGTVYKNTGLALVRIDRIKAAMDKNVAILADTTKLNLSIPPYATFRYPETED